jgi:hypothetical protein
MDKMGNWLMCPRCGGKTRIKIRRDTKLKNFPLFCPKCRFEALISIDNLIMKIIDEPDALTQSQ